MQYVNYLMIHKDYPPILRELLEAMFKTISPLLVHVTKVKKHDREVKRNYTVLDTRLLEKEGLYVYLYSSVS